VTAFGTVTARSAQEAALVVSLAHRFVSLKRSELEGNRQITDLLNRIQVFTEGSLVKAAVILSADEFDDLLPPRLGRW
jgi:hypothetical protein